MRHVVVFSIFFLLIVQPSDSQNKLFYELGAGISFSGESNKILENYGRGYSFGAAIARELRDDVVLILNASYSRYYHSGNNPPLATPRIYGFRRTTEGEPGNVFDFGIGARYFLWTGRVSSFLQLNTGAMLTRDGAIIVREWYDDSPEYTWERLYNRGGTYYLDGYYSIGIGYYISASRSIKIIPQAMFQSSFHRKQIYYPVKVNVQLALR